MKPLILAALILVSAQPAMAGTYRESFNDGLAQGWEAQEPDAWSVVGNPGGNLHYQLASAATPGVTDIYTSTYSTRVFKDMEFAATLTTNTVRPAYIIFRATPDFTAHYDASTQVTTYTGTGYAFGMSCSRNNKMSFFIYKLTNGIETVIQSWTGTTHLYCNGAQGPGDRLKVIANGASLTFYANDVQVSSYVDPTPIVSGRIGLYSVTDDFSATTTGFDTVVATKLVSGEPSATAVVSPASHESAGGERDAQGNLSSKR